MWRCAMSRQEKYSVPKALLGLLTIIAIIVVSYFSYKTLAYILNWEQPPGDALAAYQSYMMWLIYTLFLLTVAFILYETFKKWEKQQ
jgi:ABC-type transport system involved in multi-copper enzyme maturation permease subunit